MSLHPATERPVGHPSTQLTPTAPAAARTPLGVPWKTVLALAAVMAYADGFWLTSLRGAVGAIERSQSPFSSWLRESTLVLPIFVLAVLAAMMLALRWFGPALRTPKALVATGLMVVAAGTIVGVGGIIASSAYDYHLQFIQMRMMDSMRAMCTGSCLDQQSHATLVVHVRAVWLISRWLLLTNLVLVAWLVAMWGGRLRISRPIPADETAPTPSPGGDRGGRVGDLRLVLVASLLASAAVHAAVIPEHLTEWAAAGMFFLLLTIWELAVAGMLLARLEERTMLLAAVAVSVGPLALWLFSRTAGLPFGPGGGLPEPIGLADVMACLLELASLAAAVALLRAQGRRARPAASAHLRSAVLVALLAVTLIGLAGSGLSMFDSFDLSGARSVMHMTHA